MTNETAPLSIGKPAPQFRLPAANGVDVSLSDFTGSKVVLFFYPRANTLGCTTEARDFTALHQQFQEAGAVVLGVSADSLKALCSFIDKKELGVPLLSDTDGTMLRAYGAWGTKSMYGKTFDGVIRSTVLIDRAGLVTKVWSKVKVAGHAQEVLLETQKI